MSSPGTNLVAANGLTRSRAHHQRRWQPAFRRGFTIIELLVVAAIIILLLSMVLVGVNAATRSAQKARTAALMDTISKGLIRFKEDIGYYPPVLGLGTGVVPTAGNLNDQRRLWPPPNPDLLTLADYEDDIQGWYSTTSIADYLVGWDHHYHDGYGRVPNADGLHDWNRGPDASGAGVINETPPLGIRHTGYDGVWGATNAPPSESGRLCYRMGGNGGCDLNSDWPGENSSAPKDLGKVFGPYIEITDQRLMGCIVDVYPNGVPTVAFPGDANYDPENPHVVVDYWGEAIRYYRRPYPIGALDQSYRGFDRDGDGDIDPAPTLSDYYFLRPFNIPPGQDVPARFNDKTDDNATTQALEAAEYALFSLGPDRRFNHDLRIDDPDDPNNDQGTEFANQDNLLGVGP